MKDLSLGFLVTLDFFVVLQKLHLWVEIDNPEDFIDAYNTNVRYAMRNREDV